MALEDETPAFNDAAIEVIRSELEKDSPAARRAFEKFFLAALGSIPWVGGFVAAAAAFKMEESGVRRDNLQTQWLEEHQRKLQYLLATLEGIASRFENLGPSIDARVQSEEYLNLVRRAFRAWDRADTEEKRHYVGNVVANSAGTRLCSDDVVRLFVDWLDLYHEIHFAVIRQIHKRPRSTRYDIWTALYGHTPREDSAEADLFKLLIRDLSTGGVIRQEREVTTQGQFVRQTARTRRPAPPILESAFERTKPYVLTELGGQFVHYTITEAVARIGSEQPSTEDRDPPNPR